MTRAPLGALAPMLRTDPALADLLGGDGSIIAVPEPVRAFAIAGLVELSSTEILLIAVATAAEAERLEHDLGAFVDADRVVRFPAWETLPFERMSPSIDTMGERLRAIYRVFSRRETADQSSRPLVVIAPVKALMQRLAIDPIHAAPLVVSVGDRVEIDAIASQLSQRGYRREYQVEHRGEFAVRGGIVDVFPSTGDIAVRVDCFGDEVDRLTSFDISDQRSIEEVEHVEIFGCREFFVTDEIAQRAAELAASAPFARDRFDLIANRELFDGVESFLPWLVDVDHLMTDLLLPNDRVIVVEPRRAHDRALELLDEEAALASSLAQTWLSSSERAKQDDFVFPRLHVHYDRLFSSSRAPLSSWLAIADAPETARLLASSWPQFLGDASSLARRIGELAKDKVSVVVVAEGRGSADRLVALLEENGCIVDRSDPAKAEDMRHSGVHVVVGSLDRGFVCPGAKLAVLSESDATGRRRPHRVPKRRARPVEGFFDDLVPGSFVVHHVHGVARYEGMVRRAIGGSERDYLQLAYRGDDRLYVPSDQIDAITPYTGGEHPSLSRLGGGDWQKQRARVRQAVRAVAQELVVLYQRRLATPGHGFALDTPWQKELEDGFPYPETADQLRSINEVKQDMERATPMDRLVCGDVGFGKTEVAVRAVFKAVQDGKQAAVLVPTTLLASQHFQTFSERYAPFPVRVEMLSRFLTPGEARRVVAGLADGSVDVVIGTHRLLADDVKFADLGLLVVDEEQRFGVSHKETMKKLRIGVDVLTLSANPIPRTLEMSLTGIRDLSIIDTPPASRQPILTYVGEQDDHAVAEAVRRELLREGQVFFVHNRVRDIEKVAAHLRELAPEARVGVAHGQMDEGTLEEIMYSFSEKEYDVLVCTTIIESGIDMPTVNTMVVDRADLLGLDNSTNYAGELGAPGSRAYAYLFHPSDRVLSEQAYERLKTIGEHTELGSGFKIAMRDLEIRGAGNLLGTDQSGHIAAVGYDLYVKMVAEAVSELKGEEPTVPAEIKLDLPVDAHLPADYVEREDLRLEAYRRLAQVREENTVADIRAEWLDRFGPLPRAAEALLEIASLRAACVRTGVREVNVVKAPIGSGARPGELIARISPLAIKVSGQVRLKRVAPKAIYKEEIGQLIVPLRAGKSLASDLVDLLDALAPSEDSAVA